MDISAGRQPELNPGIPTGLVSLTNGVVDIGRRALPNDATWNLAAGTAAVVGEATLRTVNAMRGIARPVLGIALRPPLVPSAWQPARVIEALQRRGQQERIRGGLAIERSLDLLVPVLVEQVLNHLDLNAIVKEHVDVEAIVATVDLDAVVDRVDVDKIAGRLNVDSVLDRIDLNAIVRERVDLNAVVRDVDIDAVAGRLDVYAVINRLDLAALAQQVIDAVDLPDIIRDSTGSMASEAVRGVRMQSIEADEAISRVIDRIFRRHRVPVSIKLVPPKRSEESEE